MNKKNSSKEEEFVPGTGVEPACPCGHMNLNHARLPIPPSGQGVYGIAKI